MGHFLVQGPQRDSACGLATGTLERPMCTRVHRRCIIRTVYTVQRVRPTADPLRVCTHAVPVSILFIVRQTRAAALHRVGVGIPYSYDHEDTEEVSSSGHRVAIAASLRCDGGALTPRIRPSWRH